MNPLLHDLRLLKLAEMYEIAFERFVLEVTTAIVTDDEVRTRLRRLADPGEDHHERIAAELRRLSALVRPEDQPAVEHAAVLDVRDVEAAARDFYERHVTSVHDPRVAQLFRQLAREEERHVAIAEDALRIARSNAGGASVDDEPPRDRLVRLGEGLPLHEGVTDLSRTHHPR